MHPVFLAGPLKVQYKMTDPEGIRLTAYSKYLSFYEEIYLTQPVGLSEIDLSLEIALSSDHY